MSRAKQALLVMTAALGLGAVVACSAMDEASSFPNRNQDGGGPTSNEAKGGGNDGASPSGALGAPTATGVVLLHSAGFPSFRLCFSRHPELRPQPDSKIMPNANVVGVETGSVVRIDPLDAPGTVYVIDESRVRSTVEDPAGATCGELMENLSDEPNPSPYALQLNTDFHVANTLDSPLGKNQVHVLAITGCGSQARLDQIAGWKPNTPHTPPTGCGAGWDETSGNLSAKMVELPPTSGTANETSVPVQLFYMSPAIEAYRGSGKLGVTFGTIKVGAAVSQKSITGGTLFTGGPQESITFDQLDQASYANYGFTISVGSPSGNVVVTQSLAAVQELSAPGELPNAYYRAASNYALLLLGDPNHKATLDGGAANPSYNPRRAVHLLAVPVLDPTKADAGADAATAEAGPDASGGT